jgi:hypothetical protein
MAKLYGRKPKSSKKKKRIVAEKKEADTKKYITKMI